MRFTITDEDMNLPSTLAVERVGASIDIEISSRNGYEVAILNKTQALSVAAALYSAAKELVPEQGKQPAGYLVVHAPIDKAETTPEWRPPASRGLTRLNSFFMSLDVAKATAQEWAAKYKRGYTVYAVTEIGTAAPSAPPVSWTER